MVKILLEISFTYSHEELNWREDKTCHFLLTIYLDKTIRFLQNKSASRLEVKRAKARLKARTEPSRALGSAQLSSPNSISEKAQLSSARQI